MGRLTTPVGPAFGMRVLGKLFDGLGDVADELGDSAITTREQGEQGKGWSNARSLF
jgi:hypothetical protein